MAEYIEREALLKSVGELKKSPWYNDDYGFGTKQARHEGVGIVVDLCIRQDPSVDVVEVKYGEWLWNRGCAYGESPYYCSLCIDGGSDNGRDNYCPNCGAKMNGGE